MQPTKILIPTALVAVAAATLGLACTATSDETNARTQAVQSNLPGEPHGNPPGNNGTVKIQESGAVDEIPDNDPHVGCVFNIEFRGFDKGDLHAQWTLSAQPPSGQFIPITTQDVLIGEDGAGGANDLDRVVEVKIADYDLSAFYEHPQQGYHLKLEVHADGSHGADTKFKVFWVQGCQATPPPPSSSSGGSSSGESTPDGGKTW